MDINVTEEIGNVAGIKPGDKIGDKEIVIKNEGNIDIGSVKLTSLLLIMTSARISNLKK